MLLIFYIYCVESCIEPTVLSQLAQEKLDQIRQKKEEEAQSFKELFEHTEAMVCGTSYSSHCRYLPMASGLCCLFCFR